MLTCVAASRAPWFAEPPAATGDAFHADDGVAIDQHTGAIESIGGVPLVPTQLYDVVLDSWLLKANVVLTFHKIPTSIPRKFPLKLV